MHWLWDWPKRLTSETITKERQFCHQAGSEKNNRQSKSIRRHPKIVYNAHQRHHKTLLSIGNKNRRWSAQYCTDSGIGPRTPVIKNMPIIGSAKKLVLPGFLGIYKPKFKDCSLVLPLQSSQFTRQFYVSLSHQEMQFLS